MPSQSGRTRELGYVWPVSGPTGSEASTGASLGESGSHVEIHQPIFQFRHRCAVLPAHAGVDGENRQHAPVVGGVCVVDGLPEIFVGIAECDRTGVGNADEEIGEVRSGCCAGKREAAARVLLEVVVVLLLAKIAASGDVVVAAIDSDRSRKAVGAIAIEGALRVGEGGDSAGKAQRRRAPVGGVLIVAGDTGCLRRCSACSQIRDSPACANG